MLQHAGPSHDGQASHTRYGRKRCNLMMMMMCLILPKGTHLSMHILRRVQTECLSAFWCGHASDMQSHVQVVGPTL